MTKSVYSECLCVREAIVNQNYIKCDKSIQSCKEEIYFQCVDNKLRRENSMLLIRKLVMVMQTAVQQLVGVLPVSRWPECHRCEAARGAACEWMARVPMV